MKRNSRNLDDEPIADPFGEHAIATRSAPMSLLGARFVFESSSPWLLRLVEHAFGGLPPHRLGARAPRITVGLVLGAKETRRRAAGEPPPLHMQSGSGYLIGAQGSSSFVCVSPAERKGLVSVAESMRGFPYHTRYELIEFAVFMLASRCQGLVSLHGACVARNGRAVLLMGASGAGKSTVTLQCLLQGFDMVSEDSVFMEPNTLRATGLANFLHVTGDSLSWVGRARALAGIRSSPVIQRRSGVKKFELDLRRGGYRLAASPPKVVALAFLSAEEATGRPLLSPLPFSECRSALAAAQAYAARQAGWSTFERALRRIPAFVLRRGRNPRDSARALDAVLGPRGDIRR